MKNSNALSVVFLSVSFFSTLPLVLGDKFDEDKYGVKFASDCEVCKIVTFEFQDLLDKSGKSSQVIETGYSVDKAKKKTKYAKSELRLVEALESLCERLLDYNIHKERTDSSRFARGTSQTFQALEGLVAKGVKVDIGIPQELWKKPSAEISQLKVQCESLLEEHEETIETWYFKHQDASSLEDFLCRKRFLKNKDSKCLNEKGEVKHNEL